MKSALALVAILGGFAAINGFAALLAWALISGLRLVMEDGPLMGLLVCVPTIAATVWFGSVLIALPRKIQGRGRA